MYFFEFKNTIIKEMKKIITIILGGFLLFGCNENLKQKNTHSNTITKPEKNIAASNLNINSENNNFEQLNLIPIDTVDSKNKDVYKKYGIEFSGNCYDCDLAEFSVTEKTIQLTNVCDAKLNQVFAIVKITNTKSKIEIKTKQNNFVFTEIHKATIYQLEITGKDIQAESFRISKYFTLKKLLKKFEQHDCGDFEG